jgi:dynactin complex subunit
MHNKITQAIEICKNKFSTQKVERSVKCFRKIPLNNAPSSIMIKPTSYN